MFTLNRWNLKICISFHLVVLKHLWRCCFSTFEGFNWLASTGRNQARTHTHTARWIWMWYLFWIAWNSESALSSSMNDVNIHIFHCHDFSLNQIPISISERQRKNRWIQHQPSQYFHQMILQAKKLPITIQTTTNCQKKLFNMNRTHYIKFCFSVPFLNLVKINNGWKFNFGAFFSISIAGFVFLVQTIFDFMCAKEHNPYSIFRRFSCSFLCRNKQTNKLWNWKKMA